MNSIQRLTQKIIEFRDERDWAQFHNPKDVALSLVLEATEVLEHFQWKNGVDVDEYVEKNKQDISEELADVLYWILLMSHDLNIDIEESLERKIEINNKKYPVEKSKGNSIKYNKL